MPSPPMKRKTISAGQFQAKAHPRAETVYKTAMMRSASRPPIRWPSTPALMAPTTVPASPMKTVRPSVKEVRLYTTVSCWVVPAITAVSKPNNRPPSAPTIVLFKRYEVIAMGSVSPDARAAWRPQLSAPPFHQQRSIKTHVRLASFRRTLQEGKAHEVCRLSAPNDTGVWACNNPTQAKRRLEWATPKFSCGQG